MPNVALSGIAEGRLDRSSQFVEDREGLTVRDVTLEIAKLDPDLQRAMLNTDGEPRRITRILVNGKMARLDDVVDRDDFVECVSVNTCDG